MTGDKNFIAKIGKIKKFQVKMTGSKNDPRQNA